MKLIVVKVGTHAILSEDGTVHQATLANLTEQIAALQKAGTQVVLVSSGAMGVGRRVVGESLGKKYGGSVAQKQVLASLGQHELIHSYATLFNEHGLLSAQLLLTKQDFHTRKHYFNIVRLLKEALSQRNIVPIINENDSVSIQELMFTDNDELAGLIAAQLGADKLIILTSVAGVYDKHPDEEDAQLIPVLNPKDQWQKVSSHKTEYGRGGMLSKLEIARKLSRLGIGAHIAHAQEPDVLARIMLQETVGTAILPFKKKSTTKRWLAFHYTSSIGSIYLNECLFNMIMTGDKVLSILPVGIEKYSGEFEKGDLVNVLSPEGKKIGAGIARYGVEKLKEYQGQQRKPVFIHYDHLYIESRYT